MGLYQSSSAMSATLRRDVTSEVIPACNHSGLVPVRFQALHLSIPTRTLLKRQFFGRCQGAFTGADCHMKRTNGFGRVGGEIMYRASETIRARAALARNRPVSAGGVSQSTCWPIHRAIRDGIGALRRVIRRAHPDGGGWSSPTCARREPRGWTLPTDRAARLLTSDRGISDVAWVERF
jgi:hypothetical protein